MFRSILIPISMLVGCATVSTSGDKAVEVVGQVTKCAAPVQKSVTLRAAGEVDALDTQQTDEKGSFKFSVAPQLDPKATIFIEADGHKAVARPQTNSKNVLVAELTLPCER